MSLPQRLLASARQLFSSGRRLRLYQTHYCPYCVMVRDAAAELGVDLELVDTMRDPGPRRYLMERLGRGTVPVLGIPTDEGEELLPESRDIVRFLQKLSEKPSQSLEPSTLQ